MVDEDGHRNLYWDKRSGRIIGSGLLLYLLGIFNSSKTIDPSFVMHSIFRVIHYIHSHDDCFRQSNQVHIDLP